MAARRTRLRTAACLLLAVCGTALAKPAFAERQAANGTETTGDAPMTQLDPVVPPVVDSDSVQVLTPEKAVKLFFQSSPTSRKRDGAAIAAEVDFNFLYPAVALDHSDFIGGISCTASSIKATFASAAGYQQAVKTWPTKSKFLLITSTAGCGSDDNQNGYFVASSAAFSTGSSSVTAQGIFAALNQTYANMTVTWGHASTADSSNTTLKARCEDDYCDSRDFSFNLSPQIAVDLMAGFSQSDAEANAASKNDHEAPWENAFLLWSSNTGPEEPGSKKRSVAPYEERSLEAREVEKGFNLYCVDCGISGQFTIGGRLSYCLVYCDTYGVTNAQVYIQGSMQAGLYLGLEAYAEWKKEWEKQLVLINLAGWQIGTLISVGPYIELDLKAAIGVKAEGTLLMGGGAVWSNFGATLDLLNMDNSDQYGWEPELEQKFEAKGELSAEASLGLPLSLGIGVDVDGGWWKAHAALVDEPSLKAEASISIEYINNNKYSTVDSSTIASEDNGLDLNDDCYGVKYEIYFDNALEFEALIEGVTEWTYPIWDWKYTFAEGCLGYQKPACEGTVKASPIIGEGVECNVPLGAIDVGDNEYEVGKTINVADREFCAGLCMASKKCESFSWAGDSTECQLYNVAVSDLSPLASVFGDVLVVFDKHCWQTKDCPFNATHPDADAEEPADKRKRMDGMFDARSGVYLRPLS